MEVWENKELKWARIYKASVSTQFRVLPNFHEYFKFYNVREHGKNVFYFFYKITRIEN